MRAASSVLPGCFCGVLLVHPVELIQPRLLLLWRHILGRRGQIQDRVAAGAENRSLVGRRQKAGVPVGWAREGPAARVVDDDKARQVLVLAAEPVGHPGTHAWETHQNGSGVPLVVRQHMVVRLALAGVDEGQIVRHAADMGEQLGSPDARLPILLEAVRALHQRSGKALTDANLALSLRGACRGTSPAPACSRMCRCD